MLLLLPSNRSRCRAALLTADERQGVFEPPCEREQEGESNDHEVDRRRHDGRWDGPSKQEI